MSFPITVAFSAVAFGLLLLVLSADRFVEASASTARHIGLPPLLIGMVIVGIEKHAAIKPFIIHTNSEEIDEPTGEFIQTPAEREAFS